MAGDGQSSGAMYGGNPSPGSARWVRWGESGGEVCKVGVCLLLWFFTGERLL